VCGWVGGWVGGCGCDDDDVRVCVYHIIYTYHSSCMLHTVHTHTTLTHPHNTYVRVLELLYCT